MPANIVIIAPKGESLVAWGNIASPAPILTFSAADTATVNVAAAGSVANSGSVVSGPWTITAPAGVNVTPSSGASLAVGATQAVSIVASAAGTYTLTLASAGATLSGANQSITVSGASVAPTTATLSGFATATVGVQRLYTVTLDSAADQPYVVTWSTDGSAASPTSTISTGSTTASVMISWGSTGTKSVDFSISPTLTKAGAPISVTLSGTSATALALSVPANGTTGNPSTISVVPNGVIASSGTATLSVSGGGTLGTTTLTFTAGSSAVQSTTLTRATDGTSVVTLTNDMGLTNSGSPASFASVTSIFTFIEGATVTAGRNTSTVLATGVASGATIYASPDLLPGVTLQLSGSTLSAVGDATVPTVDGSSSGSAKDAISARDVVLTVAESPAIATIVNVTQSITYAYGTNYTGRTGGLAVNRWNAVMTECNAGDVIEISPGYIHGQDTDAANYYSQNLDSAMLAVWKPCTIRNMSGQGRWKIREGTGWLSAARSGIVVYAPAEISARGTFVIEGFDIDNFGTDGFGVRVRNDSKTPGVYTYMHADVTLRNFKIGRPSGYRSLSGVSALAEVLTLEDGHIYDTGSSSGLNHNLYIGAKTMALRGLRLERTRGWTGTPYAGGTCDLDGHLAKLHAADGVIEGCAFVCGATSGPSELIQMYAGGNWSVRGCLFVDTPYPNNANGAITMVREYQTSGTPNYDWYAGINGNSLLFERNVFVGHYPRPIIWFFTSAVSANEALYASGDTSVSAERRLSSLTVQDNIAAVTSTSAPFMLSGFPGSSNAMWINNDPNSGTNWAARGNTVRTYNRGAWAFNDRELLLYTDALGAPAAGAGSASVPQFLWPHGYRNVTRSTQGLG